MNCHLLQISVNPLLPKESQDISSGLAVVEMIKDSPIMVLGWEVFLKAKHWWLPATAILGVQRVHNDVLELFVETLAVGYSYSSWYHSNHVPLIYKLISQE